MAGAIWVSSSVLQINAARAESEQQNPIEHARKALESLIDRLRGQDMPAGIFKTNGRIEATEVDVSAKYPGRLATLTVDEGDEVTAGQVVATISSPETEAQLRAIPGAVVESETGDGSSCRAHRSTQERLGNCQSGLCAWKVLGGERVGDAAGTGPAPQQIRVGARQQVFRPMLSATRLESAIKAAEADVERLQSILVDLVLVSPRSGRVQYRLARAGEVVAAGQRILTILDLNDVYMTIYLPADASRQAHARR